MESFNCSLLRVAMADILEEAEKAPIRVVKDRKRFFVMMSEERFLELFEAERKLKQIGKIVKGKRA